MFIQIQKRTNMKETNSRSKSFCTVIR